MVRLDNLDDKYDGHGFKDVQKFDLHHYAKEIYKTVNHHDEDFDHILSVNIRELGLSAN
eukprot:CAMPEP_0116871142 /NCGR_PEP_ID=MMETSP0463-20121206/1363_1 /TAXON_ID=181622 /ORGANISM="Strombidinopsis sp, Strain SopsisLIS2011" /LENGTH=58 /DNA_ID=CAMNT_0004509009 /DNA_START=908 /DNA_END=1084 /DNA_ORIENTATION=+